MRIGLIEPHLARYGGIRRMIEFANRLVTRGHDVTFYLPEGVQRQCDWMPCRARVTSIPDGLHDRLDVILFNHEPHWYLADLFHHAEKRVFYALHYGALYNKEGSWEAVRADVDLRLANSTWTADMIAAETGERPMVVLGGINPEHFRPVPVSKRYPLLCVGDSRVWKGTDTIERAATRLALPLTKYAEKNLSQGEMAKEYSAAEVFVVGSRFEGFGQPGLEALACGTPLVTTDNGGCREYAIDEVSALVVPPADADAMADAIVRIRSDRGLAARLRASGLELVREKFDWERATDRLEAALSSGPASSAGRDRRPFRVAEDQPRPVFSVVVLAWDQLAYTQRCVETVRRHTDVPYELIIVDNGSAWDARAYAAAAGDVTVLNDCNRGFAVGMNQGLQKAIGEFVVFLNNDTELPSAWAGLLLDTARRHPRGGVIVPAVTEARNPRTVRSAPGNSVEVLDPFEPPPAAVMYVMRTETALALGGWGEEFEIASAEDVDLAFKVWVNDLDIVYDSRVLVEHVGKGTAAVKLPNWRALWDRNGQVLLKKWTDPALSVPWLAGCSRERFDRNLATARSVAGWMDRYFTLRRRLYPGQRVARRAATAAGWLTARPMAAAVAGHVWRSLSPILPEPLRLRIRTHIGGAFDRTAMNRRRVR